MKKYIGTKEVEAMPMTLGEYISKSGRNPYKDNTHDESEEGYLVKYKDGYESWSPKGVFDEAYKCSDTFLDRLYIELSELQLKQDKLNDFLKTDKFKLLPKQDRTLLEAQFGAMLAYSSILLERIRVIEHNEFIKKNE